MFKFNFLEKIFEQFGYTKQTGSINNIHNYYAPVTVGGIGDANKLLGESPQLQKTYYTEGLKLLDLSEGQIEIYGEFLEDFYKKIYNQSGRKFGTTKNSRNMLNGIIFAVGSNLDNLDWKRHTSSSLREIIYVWKSINRDLNNDFAKIYKKDGKLNENERGVLKIISGCYEYFSSVHHNDESGIVGSLRVLEGNPSLEIDDCLKQDVFLKWVKNFFENISIIITSIDKEK